MALPDTGTISHSMIQAEFGVTGAFKLSEDGGPLIEFPSGAPLVKESDFYGAGDDGGGGGPIDPPPPPPPPPDPDPDPPVFDDDGNIPSPLDVVDILGVRVGGDGSCMIWMNTGFTDSGDPAVSATTNVIYNPNPAANMKNWQIVPYKGGHSVAINTMKVMGCEWCYTNNCWIMHTNGNASVNGYNSVRQGVHTILHNTKNGKNPLEVSDWGELTETSMKYHNTVGNSCLQYVDGSMTVLREQNIIGEYLGMEFWYNRFNEYPALGSNTPKHFKSNLPNGNSADQYQSNTKQLQNGRKYIYTRGTGLGNELQTVSYLQNQSGVTAPVFHAAIDIEAIGNTPSSAKIDGYVRRSDGYWYLLRVSSNKLYVYRSLAPSEHLPTAGTANSKDLYGPRIQIKVDTQSNGWDFINMTGPCFVTSTDFLMIPGRAAFFALDLKLPDEYWSSQQSAYEGDRGGFIAGFNYGEFTTSNFKDMDQMPDGSYISAVKGKIARFV